MKLTYAQITPFIFNKNIKESLRRIASNCNIKIPNKSLINKIQPYIFVYYISDMQFFNIRKFVDWMSKIKEKDIWWNRTCTSEEKTTQGRFRLTWSLLNMIKNIYIKPEFANELNTDDCFKFVLFWPIIVIVVVALSLIHA